MASDPSINAFNEQWRSSPLYAEALRMVGADPSGPLQLSDGQRKQLQAIITQRMGFQFPDGTEIDPAGNLNEDEGFAKQAKRWGPIVGAGALAAFGIPGFMPGLLGGGAAAGGAGIPALGNVNSITAGLAGGGGGLGSALTGGGILGAIGKGAGALSSLGSVLGGAARGSADQRMREGDSQVRQQQLLQQGSRDQFTAGLQGAQFQREGQDRERKQQILMQLLNNTQDSNITPGNPAIAGRMPTMTGGARPSNLTTNRESLLALLGQPQVQAPTYQPPPSLRLPTAGLGENLLGGIGLGSSILGALGSLRR
jgi:hypothetical protein